MLNMQAICRSSVSGNFVTIDRAAVRLWVETKQVKAYHFQESCNRVDVSGLEYVADFDGYASVIRLTRQGDTFKQETVLFVWTAALEVMVRVS
jgi:hypothetical protein